MKVTVEYLRGSERISDTYYYVIKIDYDPVHVQLIQDQQISALPSAQILRMIIEDDPDVLIF